MNPNWWKICKTAPKPILEVLYDIAKNLDADVVELILSIKKK